MAAYFLRRREKRALRAQATELSHEWPLPTGHKGTSLATREPGLEELCFLEFTKTNLEPGKCWGHWPEK